MLGRQSFVMHPQARLAFPKGPHKVSATHNPRQNRLLAALPESDYKRVLPHLIPTPLPVGWVMNCANHHQNQVYFITSGLVSRYCGLRDGTSSEFADTGREGAIGVATFLGGDRTPFWAEVLSAGFAYSLGRDFVAKEFAQNSILAKMFLRFIQALIAETGQSVVCGRYHRLEQRLARWLLSSLDRLRSSELLVTHELIANVLGVRRESITEALGALENVGLIHHSRGRIVLLDRPGLEALACECYAVVKREYARLLPEKPGNQPGRLGSVPVLS